MKNFLKKLNIVQNQVEDIEGSNSSKANKLNAGPTPHQSEQQNRFEYNKPFTALAEWFQTVTNKKSGSLPSSSHAINQDIMEEHLESASSCASNVGLDVSRRDSESNNSSSKDPEVEEEYQIQLAMEMSAKEDPEAVQIEAVKQISLGSFTQENTPAEVVAYRYWNYNALSYDDKILDGFYDLYGVVTGLESSRMPSLLDLQAAPVSEGISWEAILVNRAADANLLNLEQRAFVLAVKARSEPLLLGDATLVRQLASLVSDYMGGPVGEPDNMLRSWKSLSYSLRSTLRSMVLPLGSLTIGLARHRALLFKVLADSVDIPCRLVKGQLYTGFDDVAVNFVKIGDGREFIVDLMSDPGTLIPSDVAVGNIDYVDSLSSTSPLSRDIDSNMGTCSSEAVSSFDEPSDSRTLDEKICLRKQPIVDDSSDQLAFTASADLLRPGLNYGELHASTEFNRNPSQLTKLPLEVVPSRSNHPSGHARSPSWTEGVSSPAVRKMKVKDVSQYMIDAAKENPHLAQKLHDVLLESGVVAPRNLFSEVYPDQSDVSVTFTKPPIEGRQGNKMKQFAEKSKLDQTVQPKFLPPLPHHGGQPRATPSLSLGSLKPVQGSGIDNSVDVGEASTNPSVTQPDVTQGKLGKNVPISAAAAAAAAVIASSMVVAVTKTSSNPKFELPTTAAATATAAAVAATTAAVGKQHEQPDAPPHSPGGDVGFFKEVLGSKGGEGDDTSQVPHGSGKERDTSQANSEDRTSDRSGGGDSAGSTRSDMPLDDVSDCEILWEEITLGERIGLGSYGEVYRGDWRGTEVAVKRFLDQDIYGEALEEFRSEVRIMKRLRHPNVVLFMGAVTRPPNLSIVTEFLHRGSLYRLIHRPNNQLDERRRLRMAFDAARGMNYLHSCSPVIVHRDLKSPNLLVDKNWVVKVCDFGLSRMKHSTFLSSRSTAGTAEWMAPEVLRNEPSDEKCDVYSFGIILWELCTLQQPWGGMNPMQVVGAVGFQHRRLDIPDVVDPKIADIIQKCWQTDPKLRPTFSEIMAALKPLQKPIVGPQLPRPSSSRSGNNEK